jgi:multisubunit Na+/H+ antiporter MnhB subunit
MGVETILYVFLVFAIVGSLIAVETKNLLSAVISIGVVGYGLSIMFLYMGAPDIAITQVVVEVLALVVLIRGTIAIDNVSIGGPRDTLPLFVALVFFGVFVMLGIAALSDMTAFGKPLMRVSQEYLSQAAIEQTGATNVVMGILLDFRAYDTLGEATVLLTSILGSFVILRKRGKKDIAEKDMEHVGILENE